MRGIATAVALALALLAARAAARDMYTIDLSSSKRSYHEQHVEHLLRAALDASSARYGAYELHTGAIRMERDRLLQEMRKGELVNLSAQVTSGEWEQALIPIRIPVDKGISGYRLLLIDGRRQREFDAVRTLAQLKKLSLGSGRQWSTTAAYARAGFRVVEGNSTAGLHSMLAAQRFDYFPRSPDEAVTEQAAHAAQFPALAVERGLTLYVPSPRYFFVAAGQQRLARRLEYGLRLLIADGRFDRIFHQSYDELIARTVLPQRRLFKIDNPLLPPETPLANRAYWYDPFAPRGR